MLPNSNYPDHIKETLQAYDSGDKKDKSLKDAAQYIKQKLDGAKVVHRFSETATEHPSKIRWKPL